MIGNTEERALRQAIIDTCLAMNASGLNPGKAGNVSARWGAGLLVTPTGIPYAQLVPEDIVFLHADGHCPPGQRLPTSEWQFHVDILAHYPAVQAVVHSHSAYATALACLRRAIPAFHYMVAVAGGVDIRCAPYATFGTAALSGAIVAALDERRACLLANHGQIATGASLEAALALAQEVETLARQYQLALTLGEPAILDEDEMTLVLEKFKTYGQQSTLAASET